MSDWTKDATMEKLIQIRTGHPSHTVEHRMADEEIRRREASEAKRHAEDSARVQAQRHQEVMAAQEAVRGAVGRVHRIDVWILIVGMIAALAGVVLLALEILRAVRAGI
jgi:hypothetical protein